MNNLLNIFKASAGAGKTFLLTENFLKLALKNPKYYKRILAVTFTNKASEEMKTRITEEVHRLIEDPENSPHCEALLQELELPNYMALAERAKLVQDEILHNYSLFSVSTIDKFVQSIIRSFTFEMSLHSNFNLQLDTDPVIEELKNKLYQNIETNRNLRHWLIEFAKYKIRENASWDFDDEIRNISKFIFTEDFHNRNTEDFNSENLKSLEEKLYKIKNGFEGEMQKISSLANAEISKLPFQYSKLGQKTGWICNYILKKIGNKEYVPTPSILKLYNDPTQWANKTASSDVVEKISMLANLIQPLLLRAISLYEKQYVLYLSATEMLKKFYSFGLLSDISALLPEYRTEHNELLISDTTVLLKKIIQNNDAPFIYEKTGNKYNHILIDEFQDTSGFQWHNFKPLIENNLASGYFNLLVGDIKQSIYSWRGGDRNLLMYKVKEQIGENYILENNLPFNYRSDKLIVRLNNTIFKRIPSFLQADFNANTDLQNDESQNAKIMLSAINQSYSEQMQLLPSSTKNDGYFKIDFFQKQKSDDKNKLAENIHQRVGEHIAKILDLGYKPADIALLVRTNNEAKQITQALYNFQKENPDSYNYQVISEVSTEISKAQSIKILISGMKLISNSNDVIAEKELLLNYLSVKNNMPENIHLIMNDEADKTKFLPNDFFEKYDELKQLSLFEMSELLIEIFQLRLLKDEFEFLRNFQDIIFKFTQNKGNNLDEFLTWWNEYGYSQSLQTNALHEAVQVITIHKAKGLSIPHIIIPYASWRLSPRPNSVFFADDETFSFGNIKKFPISYKKDIANTIFKNSYFDHTLQTNIEALNIFYVAMTRPKNSLYVCGIYEKSKTGIKTIGDLLLLAVKSVKFSDEDEINYFDTLSKYDDGNECLEAGCLMPASEGKELGESKNIYDFYPGNNGSLKPEISYQAQDFFAENIDYIEKRVNYGSLMHQILAEITQVADSDAALRKMHSLGYITQEECEIIAVELAELLQRPSMREWFAPGLEVISEKELLNSEGEIKIPDRVIKRGKDITVIDFKFGKERPEHITQINEYKELLQEIYNQKVVGVLYYAATDNTLYF